MDLDRQFAIIDQSTPLLKFCQRFTDDSDIWDYSRHSHPYIELLFFINGTSKVDASDAKFAVSLYDTILYPTGHIHQEGYKGSQSREVICLWIDIPELILPKTIQIRDRDNTLQGLFLSTLQEYQPKEPSNYILTSYVKLLLATILRSHAMEQAPQKSLACAIQYIHNHFTEQITVDHLAKLEHISRSYLSRQFKEQTGMTMVTYVNHLRLEMAKHLLVTTDQSILEISESIGFNSPKYFYRSFKSSTDLSPLEFRRSHRQKGG